MDTLPEIKTSAIETPMFFENGSYRLFGVLHEPATAPSGWGWVFCHPFAEEKLWAQRVYVSFARMLAARGAWVLRFDAMGNGDSQGRFSDSSVDTMLSDIGCAIRRLERSSGTALNVGLLGLRFGATLAALAAERCPTVGKLVLWEPIVDGGKYMQELLRVNLTTQTAIYKEIRHNREALVRMMREEGRTVNVDGYEIAYPCYEQASAVKLNEEGKRFAGPCLIVQMGRAGQPIRAEVKVLKDTYRSADIREVVEEPFWKEIKQWYRTAPNLFEATSAWVEGR
ncbi:MAG: alpha/beta hydrolase [Nitrospirota bacterium]|nr:alpha/beta hydrolase [Nitrospirota bacterium]MDP3595378.1 alpha/beta hydrolase [Nitrospirota bacterium]